MRLFIVDPGLLSLHGHHANYDRAVAAAGRACGIETHVYCHRQVDPAAIDGLSASRAFSLSPYEVRGVGQLNLSQLNVLLRQKAAVLRAELREALTPALRPDDIVFAHTVFLPELEALVDWYEEMPEAQRPRLGVLLRFEPEAGLVIAEVAEPSHEGHRKQVRRLESLASPQRVAVVTDTPMLTAAYRAVTGSERIRTLPHPIPPRARPAPRGPRSGITYLGETSEPKGFGVALGAAALLARSRPDIPLRYQAGRGGIPPQLRASHPNVEFIPGGLSDDDYFSLIDTSSAVLTLYNPAIYRCRSSGVFSEAVIRGTMVVSSRCGSVAGYLEKLGCEFLLCRDWTAAAAAEKMAEVHDRREEYAARFAEATRALAAYHRPERFVAELLGCFGLAPAATHVGN